MKRKHSILKHHHKSDYTETHTFSRDYVCPLCGKMICLKIANKKPKKPEEVAYSDIGFYCDSCGVTISLYSVDSKMPLKEMIKIAERDYSKWEFNRLRLKEEKRKKAKKREKKCLQKIV